MLSVFNETVNLFVDNSPTGTVSDPDVLLRRAYCDADRLWEAEKLVLVSHFLTHAESLPYDFYERKFLQSREAIELALWYGQWCKRRRFTEELCDLFWNKVLVEFFQLN